MRLNLPVVSPILFLVLAGLSGCKQKAAPSGAEATVAASSAAAVLPTNYGAYVLEQGRWREINAAGNEVLSLGSEPSFLLCDARLTTGMFDPERVVTLQSHRLVIRDVEMILGRENQPTGYTVSDSFTWWPAQQPVSMTTGVVPERRELLRFSPRSPLAPGYYRVQMIGRSFAFRVGIASEKVGDVPKPLRSDRWVMTQAREDSPRWLESEPRADTGATNDHYFKGRSIVRYEFSPEDRLEGTRANAEKRWKGSAENLQPESIADALETGRRAAGFQGSDAARQAVRREAISLVTALAERSKEEKGKWVSLGLLQEALKAFPNEATLVEAAKAAQEACDQAESLSARHAKRTRDEMDAFGKRLAEIKYSWSITYGVKEADILQLFEGGMKWKNIYGNDYSVNLYDITGFEKKNDRSALGNEPAWVLLMQVPNAGHEFNFASAAHRDAAERAIEQARAAHKKKFADRLKYVVEAPVQYWGERVWVDEAPRWNFDIQGGGKEHYEVQTERGVAQLNIGKEFSLRCSQWMRFRSLDAKPLKIEVQLFSAE